MTDFINRMEFRPLTSQMVEPVAKVVSDIFLKQEPTSVCLRLTTEVFLPFGMAYVERSFLAGLGVVAIDRESSQLVGAAICLDIMEDVRELYPDLNHERFVPKLPDLAFVAAIEGPFIMANQIMHGRCAHNAQVVVSSGFQGKGIATALIKETLKRAQDKGFQMNAAVCTGPASRRAHEKCGFAQEGSLSYGLYRNADGTNPYADLEGECSLMVFRF